MERSGAILVTGSNRSGTTWVGRMLGLSEEVAYIHEPFNPGAQLPLMKVRVPGHNLHVSTSNADVYRSAMGEVLRFDPAWGWQLARARSPKDVARVGRAAVRLRHARRRRMRPLVKDPIAVFSSPWLHEEFGMDVVMMIRHPASYVSSIKRLGWEYDFAYLLSQESLIDGLLSDFRHEIERYSTIQVSPFEQAILLWKLIYSAVDVFRRQYPSWTYLKFEQVAGAPEREFGDLYARLGLRFTGAVQEEIALFTGTHNPADRPIAERHDVRRDSRSLRKSWQGRLTAEELLAVQAGVGDVADRFYDARSWRLDEAPP